MDVDERGSRSVTSECDTVMANTTVDPGLSYSTITIFEVAPSICRFVAPGKLWHHGDLVTSRGHTIAIL